MIGSFFQALWTVVDMVLGLYMGVILIEAVFSWLETYEIISKKDKRIAQIQEMLTKLTDPVLNKIRKYVPLFGGLDLSPIVAILILVFIRTFIRAYGLSV
jgi:YggT family protein